MDAAVGSAGGDEDPGGEEPGVAENGGVAEQVQAGVQRRSTGAVTQVRRERPGTIRKTGQRPSAWSWCQWRATPELPPGEVEIIARAWDDRRDATGIRCRLVESQGIREQLLAPHPRLHHPQPPESQTACCFSSVQDARNDRDRDGAAVQQTAYGGPPEQSLQHGPVVATDDDHDRCATVLEQYT